MQDALLRRLTISEKITNKASLNTVRERQAPCKKSEVSPSGEVKVSVHTQADTGEPGNSISRAVKMEMKLELNKDTENKSQTEFELKERQTTDKHSLSRNLQRLLVFEKLLLKERKRDKLALELNFCKHHKCLKNSTSKQVDKEGKMRAWVP